MPPVFRIPEGLSRCIGRSDHKVRPGARPPHPSRHPIRRPTDRAARSANHRADRRPPLGSSPELAATSGTGAGEMTPVRSVHAAGSACKSATLSSRRDTARSAHFRQAVQNKVRCLAQQNLPALPPRRGLKARPHQRQEIAAEVVSAPSASRIFTTACSRHRASS